MNEKDIKTLSEQETKEIKNKLNDDNIMLKSLDEYLPSNEKEEESEYDLDEI